jgi:hypothetical protein
VVKDSTADSYTLEWKYKNYEIESENEILKKIMSMSEDMTVLVKTDEFGAFEEVVNWKELSACMKNITTISTLNLYLSCEVVSDLFNLYLSIVIT